MVLRVAFVPGVTITKWTRNWAERYPSQPLEIVPVAEDDQRAVVSDGRADVCFVRLPIERDGLNVIRLYGEAPVAVLAKEHPLGTAAELELAALAHDTKLMIAEATPGTGPESDPTKQAVELVAAGVGVLVLPHSLARLYSRKDVVAVPLTDASETEIALVWQADRATEEIDDWVGVVRGRTAASSRGRQVDAEKTAKKTSKKTSSGTQKSTTGRPASAAGRHPAAKSRRGSSARKPRRRGR